VNLNRRFFRFYTAHRPYIVLKWAQTASGMIAGLVESPRLLVTNAYTNRLVHKWRAEEASILVGTRTALVDDPALTARLWSGPDPIRLVIDKELRLPPTLQLFDRKVKTIVFNLLKHKEEENIFFYQLSEDSSLVQQIIIALHHLKIQSVLVEGGARLLQSFIDEDDWDEARVIVNNELEIPAGLPAPGLRRARLVSRNEIVSDSIRYYEHE
jgi:diaminohydroxyphosphoribosylaminopyrimidine deaminase/5-amino-6-(5-phosphoribosylamino)uracil reductase